MEQQNKSAGVSDVILCTGKAVGVAAALFTAPVAFVMTQVPVHSYFAAFLGQGAFATLLTLLTWLIGGLEAIVIFGVVTVTVALLASWLATALIARGFR